MCHFKLCILIAKPGCLHREIADTGTPDHPQLPKWSLTSKCKSSNM